MSFRLVFAILAFAWTLMMPGCSSPSSTPQTPPLDGTSWILSSLPGRTLVGEEKVTAQFSDGRVFGSDGCNRYSTSVFIDGSSIIVGPRGPSTMMACPPEVMEQADAFMAAMFGSMTYRAIDGRLELVGSDGAVRATFAAQSTALAGTTWEAIAINNGRGAVTGLVADTSVTMSFDSEGKLSGSGGCNRYTATWTQEGSSMRLSAPASTRRMCPEEGVMEQEQAFFAAMQTVSTMRFEGDRLEMRTADDALALMMQRSGE